jgi:hypothetical protein
MINILEMSDVDIVTALADGDKEAKHILELAAQELGTDKFRIFAIDLDDMQMRGRCIVSMFAGWCNHEVEAMRVAAANRDSAMVKYVNAVTPDANAREHGEQKRIAPLDGAIRNILADAEAQGNLKRLDEGAEYIHNFFLSMLLTMQRDKKFVSNFRLNLAGIADKAAWGVFAIHFVEVVDADGNPLGKSEQPNAEDDNAAAAASIVSVNMSISDLNDDDWQPVAEGQTFDTVESPTVIDEYLKEFEADDNAGSSSDVDSAAQPTDDIPAPTGGSQDAP